MRRTTPFVDERIIPVPIRADVTVQVFGLPFDLTTEEARKIGAVILALASLAESPKPSIAVERCPLPPRRPFRPHC